MSIRVEKANPDPGFEAQLGYIQESRRLDFRGYTRTGLRRRSTLRMEASTAEDFATCRARLEAKPSEFEDLLNTVLINVTSFFRDTEVWHMLRENVVPGIGEVFRQRVGVRLEDQEYRER